MPIRKIFIDSCPPYMITQTGQVSAQTKQKKRKHLQKTKVTDLGHLTFFPVTSHRHNQSSQMIYQNFPQHILHPKNVFSPHSIKAAKLYTQKTGFWRKNTRFFDIPDLIWELPLNGSGQIRYRFKANTLGYNLHGLHFWVRPLKKFAEEKTQNPFIKK